MNPTNNHRAFFKNLLILIGLLLLLFFWTKPTWQTISQISQNLTQEAVALTNSTSSTSWSTIDSYLTLKEKELNNTSGLLHAKGQELAFFARLEALAEIQGLTVTLRLEENNPIVIPQAQTLTVNAETQGNKTNVLRFLQALEKEPGIVLTQVNLNSGDSINLVLQISIQSFWR